jgi:hypothetical protein
MTDLPEQTDGVVTLRERVRERLWELIDEHTETHDGSKVHFIYDAADAIMKEFALRPLSQGVVNSDTEEAEWS